MEAVVSSIGVFGLLSLVFLALGPVGIIFWIWMLIECATEEPREGNNKVVWTLIIVFTHLIRATPYFLRRPVPRSAAAT